MNEVPLEWGCDWDTLSDTVIAFGTALVDDDPHRIGERARWDWTRRCSPGSASGHPEAVDLDRGCGAGALFGRCPPAAAAPSRAGDWPSAARNGRARIAWATLGLSGPYRAVFDRMLPDAL